MTAIPHLLFVTPKWCGGCLRTVFGLDEFGLCRSCSRPFPDPPTLEELRP